jgi:hypothetical protein
MTADEMAYLYASCTRLGCNHTRYAHEHLRKGTECSVCECPEFKSRRWWHALLRK